MPVLLIRTLANWWSRLFFFIDMLLEDFKVPDGYNVDQATGYLEAIPRSDRSRTYLFSAERKKMFIFGLRHGRLCIKKLCAEIKINFETYIHHYKVDPVFREHVEDTRLELIDEVERVLYKCALDPKKSHDRIFWLRHNYPEKYADRQTPDKVEINIDMAGLQRAFDHAKVVEGRVKTSLLKEQIEKEKEPAVISEKIPLLTYQPVMA